MNWQDLSEINIGLLLNKRTAINVYHTDNFFPPYNDLFKAIKLGKDIEELIEFIGLEPVQAAIEAAKTINGTSGLADWVAMLERAKINYEAGQKLEKMGRKLQQGEQVDWSLISSLSANTQKGVGKGFIPLSKIKACEIPFKLTGFKSIDEHIGGLPLVGQVIVGAPAGTGKTTFMSQLTGCWAKTHSNDTVAVFTLEMVNNELKKRYEEVLRLSDEAQSRILIEDEPLTAEEVVSRAASIENLGLVAIDFADLLIRGETTESAMSHIYRTFMLGAKSLNCPVVLLSQLSRTYEGGIPRPQSIRWTGLAEALGWMILMLYNPSTDYFAEDDEDLLPIVNEMGYIIVWKIRGGFRKHVDESPGAIQLPFKGELGWHYNASGKWFSLRKAGSNKEERKRKH